MPKSSPTKKQTVAVIGAGIAGLSCAYELQKAGFDVTVFEKESLVGGRMSTREKNGFPFDIGANHLCDLYDEIKQYCDEFGLEFKPMKFLKYGVLKQGTIHSFSSVLGLFSKVRLACNMLGMAIRGEKLSFLDLSTTVAHDDESAHDFMIQHCGEEVVNYLVDPFATTYQFHRSHEISKGALLAIMQSIQSQKKRWNLYHLKDEMIALPNALAERLNVQRGQPIESINALEKGRKGIEITSKDTSHHFDAVVVATPASTTQKIYKNPSNGQTQLLSRVKYATTIGFAFKTSVNHLPDTSVVWVPFVENQTISGYTNERMKGEALVQNEESLICVWLHESFAQSILEKTDNELFEIVKKELIKVCPWFKSTNDLENHDLQRWPEAMPKFYPGYLTTVDTFLKTAQGEQTVFFCGDYLNSPWTEGALRCGKRVAEQVQEKFNEVRR